MIWILGGLTGGVIVFGCSLYRITRKKGVEVDREIAIARKIQSA